MHEYSLIQALLERVDAAARQHGATRVERLRVRVGELAGVERELLASAYELARTGTCCAAAELELLDEPARWECGRCGAAIARGAVLRCGECGAPARLAGGDAIVLERLEMEVP